MWNNYMIVGTYDNKLLSQNGIDEDVKLKNENYSRTLRAPKWLPLSPPPSIWSMLLPLSFLLVPEWILLLSSGWSLLIIIFIIIIPIMTIRSSACRLT